MKRRAKRRGSKKGRGRKTVLLLILIGTGISILFLFRQPIFDALKPALEIKESREKKGVTLYFSDLEGGYLVGEKREILKWGDVEKEAGETIHELTKGPKRNFIPTLPKRTRLISLQIEEGGLAKVNFNKSLAEDHPGGSSAEMMTLYSIVNTLTFNFPQIKQVQILIEGKTIETISGHLSLRSPVSANPELIKNQH